MLVLGNHGGGSDSYGLCPPRPYDVREAIKQLEYRVIRVRPQAPWLLGHGAEAPSSDLGEAQRGFRE